MPSAAAAGDRDTTHPVDRAHPAVWDLAAGSAHVVLREGATAAAAAEASFEESYQNSSAVDAMRMVEEEVEKLSAAEIAEEESAAEAAIRAHARRPAAERARAAERRRILLEAKRTVSSSCRPRFPPFSVQPDPGRSFARPMSQENTNPPVASPADVMRPTTAAVAAAVAATVCAVVVLRLAQLCCAS
eukprot:CAMPEP_0181256452 /NCGR_PEP_ID=MMETSP1096-20121128/49720_1 /TAXON_ID=156174 ORGANISM="Chrysochromulina ericina, Strain CCMP281" /NCGR_SAMPLE_ID=MMETSP1096 /ASSEMBLY_ACC=CAM_ASM_000453 /LENGTH=187 /DNA_ID=CAMNT_0023354707 /DNA_START=184 /DNA_END=749 /DNA_ORIENTATION=-